MDEKKLILDSKSFLKVLSFKDGLSMTLKIINLLLADKKVEKIIVTDKMLDDIEKIKNNNSIAMQVCLNLNKLFDKQGLCEYIDLNTEKISEDELLDYAISSENIFLSFDLRINLKYQSRKQIDNSIIFTEGQLEKFIELQKSFDKLDNFEIEEYLEKIFQYSEITPIEFIKLSERERYVSILKFLIDDKLKSEKSEYVFQIEDQLLLNKEGKISDFELKKNLEKLKNYNFGRLNCKESLKEKYKDLIKRFLEEKNISSFEELLDLRLFETEEAIINQILKYYNV